VEPDALLETSSRACIVLRASYLRADLRHGALDVCQVGHSIKPSVVGSSAAMTSAFCVI
jgi:hypothetical protein